MLEGAGSQDLASPRATSLLNQGGQVENALA